MPRSGPGGLPARPRKLPETLAELSPKYIAEVPKNPFSDADLLYKPEADGYLLYSVGPNGKDDGGHNFNEEFETWSESQPATEEQKSWDDIAIRTPPKKS